MENEALLKEILAEVKAGKRALGEELTKVINEKFDDLGKGTDKKLARYAEETDRKFNLFAKEIDKKLAQYTEEIDKKLAQYTEETDKKLAQYSKETDDKLNKLDRKTDEKFDKFSKEIANEIREVADLICRKFDARFKELEDRYILDKKEHEIFKAQISKLQTGEEILEKRINKAYA